MFKASRSARDIMMVPSDKVDDHFGCGSIKDQIFTMNAVCTPHIQGRGRLHRSLSWSTFAGPYQSYQRYNNPQRRSQRKAKKRPSEVCQMCFTLKSVAH